MASPALMTVLLFRTAIMHTSTSDFLQAPLSHGAVLPVPSPEMLSGVAATLSLRLSAESLSAAHPQNSHALTPQRSRK